jgi:2-hydroxycyclohexanecarboxyl-CoA dehydrogenase
LIDLHGMGLVVVGGGSGIGRALTLLAKDLGAKVAVAERDVSCRAAALEAGAHFLECDATSLSSMEAAFESAGAALGRINAIVTTIGGAKLGEFETFSEADWKGEIDFNLGSAFAVTKAGLPHLRKAGGGALILTSSGYGSIPGADRVAYTAAKSGVFAMTRSLASAFASANIRVNCVAPGPTDTPRFRAMNGGDEGVARVREAMPLKRIPKPDDCAKAMIFLLSDGASEITGQTLHVNGGLLMP